jgi:putative ABC transport system permease protein
VVVEVAFAVVLLFGSGLLIRSFLRLLAVDPGFRPEHVLILRVSVSKSKTIPQIVSFYQQALEHVKGVPGVRSAGLIGDIFQRRNPDLVVNVEGHSPRENEPVSNDAVSPGLFQAVGVPLLRGRYFSEQDGPHSAPVAIVDETMARHFWPGEDPIGRRFNNISVVGIVGDMRSQGLEKQPISQYFVPYTQDDSLQMYDMELVVRSGVDPLQLAVAVRGEIRLLDKTVFLHDVTTLEDRMREGMSQRRFQTTLLGFLAAVALVLAAVGIYGVMHYSVSQRTHEIGIRMALGARAEDVLLMILRRGLTLALIGVIAGLIGALWLTETMSSLLFGVTSTDPVTFAFTSVLLTSVALLASYIPARRATKVDPMVALRHE